MQNITAKDFYKETPYNEETKNSIWLSQISDSHDNFCHCNTPFAHLLASIFPPGHKDRDLTINQILVRDYTALCLSGGTEETGHGSAHGTGDIKENIKREDLQEGDVEDLLMAAAADAVEEEKER